MGRKNGGTSVSAAIVAASVHAAKRASCTINPYSFLNFLSLIPGRSSCLGKRRGVRKRECLEEYSSPSSWSRA